MEVTQAGQPTPLGYLAAGDFFGERVNQRCCPKMLARGFCISETMPYACCLPVHRPMQIIGCEISGRCKPRPTKLCCKSQALLAAEPRFATVTCTSECRLLRLPAAAYRRVLQNKSALAAIRVQQREYLRAAAARSPTQAGQAIGGGGGRFASFRDGAAGSSSGSGAGGRGGLSGFNIRDFALNPKAMVQKSVEVGSQPAALLTASC